MRIVVGKDEDRHIPLLWVGAESQLDYDIVLAEPGASLTLWGLLIGKGSQELKLNVTVTHAAPNTRSRVNVKSVLYDRSKTVVNGMVKVEAGARGTDAWLAAHMMLLSDTATGEAVPGLEIIENDIKAGHATTIGRIDELQMFYLMSRGLDRQSAKALIVQGFLQDAIEGLEPDMRVQALGALEHEL